MMNEDNTIEENLEALGNFEGTAKRPWLRIILFYILPLVVLVGAIVQSNQGLFEINKEMAVLRELPAETKELRFVLTQTEEEKSVLESQVITLENRNKEYKAENILQSVRFDSLISLQYVPIEPIVAIGSSTNCDREISILRSEYEQTIKQYEVNERNLRKSIRYYKNINDSINTLYNNCLSEIKSKPQIEPKKFAVIIYANNKLKAKQAKKVILDGYQLEAKIYKKNGEFVVYVPFHFYEKAQSFFKRVKIEYSNAKLIENLPMWLSN